MTTVTTKASQETTSPYAAKPWLKNYDYWIPEKSTFPRQSIYQVLNITATYFPDRPATAFLGAELTFRDLKVQVDKLATAFSRLGIVKGDRVGVMLPNSPQYLICFFALTRLGAIVTNVNPIYTAREVHHVAVDSGMRMLITLEMLAHVAMEIKPGTDIEHLVTTSVFEYSASPPETFTPPEGTLSLTALMGEVEHAELPRVEINAEEDVAALIYTGGTTGVPKGAMLTHYNLNAAIVQCTLWAGPLGRRGEERFLVIIPMFHVYGLVICALLGVSIGAMQILLPKYSSELLLQSIKQYQPTYFPGVPTLFISLLNSQEALKNGLDRIMRFNCGSAPLPVEVIEQFERLSGAILFEGWGMTETSAVGTSTPALTKYKPGSIGFPFTSAEMKIVDVNDPNREVPIGAEGELCIRGPQVMKGYWNKPEETAIALRDGWLHTGDIGRMDEDGYFYIVQRKKDMIIVSGFNVYPSEVEEELLTHPAIAETAVIGVNDLYRGETVKAFVVLKENVSATPEELTKYCRGRLAKYKIPTSIEFLSSLPKNEEGVISRRWLREQEEAKRSEKRKDSH